MADLKISQLTGATTPLAGTEVLPIVQSSSTKKVAVSDLTAGRDIATGSITSTKTSAGAVVDIATIQNASSTAGTEAALFFAPTTATGNIRGARISAVNDGSNVIGLKLYTGSAGTITSKLEIDGATTGDVTLKTGNLVQGTAAKGFNFTANTPAAGMTSQLLNWYEEGTWTGALVCGTSGTITLNSSFVTGSYTRVGRLVTVTGIFLVSSVSTPVGALFLTGLPYANSSAQYGRTAAAVFATDLAATATGSIVGRMLPSTTQIELYKYAAGAISNLAGDVIAGSQFNINMSYVV